MRFVKASTGEATSFDSSPQYSLCKQHGYAEGSVQLEETNRTDMMITFNVKAKTTADGRAHHVGTLFQKTRAAIRSELAGL